MLPDKITIKLTVDESVALSNVLQIYLINCTHSDNLTSSMKGKMNMVLLSEVYKKLRIKTFIFNKMNINFSFTTPQAIAFWFVFNDSLQVDNFSNNLIETICRTVHQKVA